MAKLSGNTNSRCFLASQIVYQGIIPVNRKASTKTVTEAAVLRAKRTCGWPLDMGEYTQRSLGEKGFAGRSEKSLIG
jgi:hypothetical protein